MHKPESKTVGVYKVGNVIEFEANDTNFAVTEVINVVKMLLDFGYNVVVINDEKLPSYSKADFCNLEFATIDSFSGENMLDYLLVFNGPLEGIDFIDYDNIEALSSISKSSHFVLTDMRIMLPDRFNDLFDIVLTQSPNHISEINSEQAYNGMPESILYNNPISEFNAGEKDIDIIFGGTERNRTIDFLEYVWRPDVTFYGKAPTVNFEDNRLPANEFLKVLERAKFSPVIADPTYNKNGFVTQRFYECISSNIVPFVDAKYDRFEKLISHDDWKRVSSYKQMREKINVLLENKLEHEYLINKQQEDYIKDEYVHGAYTISCLLQEDGFYE